MRRFVLESSTGEPVAEGVVFSDGRVAVRWQRQDLPGSTVCWDSIDDAIAIHTGIGSWRLRFLDDLPPGMAAPGRRLDAGR